MKVVVPVANGAAESGYEETSHHPNSFKDLNMEILNAINYICGGFCLAWTMEAVRDGKAGWAVVLLLCAISNIVVASV